MYNTKKKYLFENAHVLKAILKLSIPSLLSQLILVIYNMADTFFIGLASKSNYYVTNNLTNDLVAGVTICTSVFMMLTAISNLFGVGASSVMARSQGKNRLDRATAASNFSFWGSLGATIIYCLFVLLLLDPITYFLSGNSQTVTGYAKTYILYAVIIFGIPTVLNNLFSHLLRAEGRALHASIGIALGGLLNVALDPLFIFVLFKIEDAALAAALATGISNCIALLYYVFFFIKIKIRKETLLSIRPRKKMFSDYVPYEVLKIGLPACLMTLFENFSYMIFDSILGNISTSVETNTAALAGAGAAKKINMFAHSMARGMSQGVLPLIGYNKSSGRRKRMKKIILVSTSITVGLASICLLVNSLAARPLCSLFLHEENALDLGSAYLIIFSIGAPFSAFAYCVISFFQAVGKAWRSLLLAVLRKGILDIPLMFILKNAITYQTGIGVVWATPIADIICSIVAAILIFTYLKHHASKNKPQIAEESIDPVNEINNI